MTRSLVLRRILLISVPLVIAVTLSWAPLGRMSRWGGSLALPMTRTGQYLAAQGHAVASLFRDPGRVRALEEEVATLRAQVAMLLQEHAERTTIAEVLRANAALRVPGTPVLARVLAGQFTPLRATMTVAFGGNAETIADGDPVLWNGALLGTVRTHGSGRAVVRLLSDPDTRIGVARAHALGVMGVLEGGVGGGLRVTKIPADQTVTVGDAIVTAALEERIPSGIPIGTITEVRPDPDGFFQTAAIDVAHEPRRATVVTVLHVATTESS
ncbi:rod shape-determining protein MreC [Candidatus Uhrbacteria bacterium]|nr:rod shape-determining protein MreC [Candidatus Uhrbacteria bacterium]